MALDLIVRNATLPDGRSGIDIACRDGRITEVGARIAGDAATIVDAGRVVGTWRHQGTGARRRVVAEPFGDLTARARRAVERAGH